ncbi:MAG: trypsin-like peptidase domain-containing protein [Bacteroidia bacterium]|nr:trypsin-like peptidase domain-containing protein [Bacteroidia bacterium]NNK90625.1 trypsin-like serine protease [Saprospiraceae bacterium]
MKFSHIFLALLLLSGGFFTGKYFSKEQENTQITDNQDVINEIPQEINKKSAQVLNKPSLNSNINITSESATIALFEEAAPSVVFITTTSQTQNYWSMDLREIPKGTGTGFMWDIYGHIVTNFHVIENGNIFNVTLSDQSSYEAEFVGASPGKDLAVLKIKAPAEKLKPIPLGRSSNVKVGQSAYAIGNPFGFDQTLTTGVISALGREITASNGRKIYDVLQTDAAINPGNSGGPLLDSSGKLIGVNTAIYSPSGAYSGIGFSIPSDVVNFVVPDLIEYGQEKRPIIGIELLPDAYVTESGAMIRRVVPNSPAEKVGLKGLSRTRSGRLTYGDLIRKIDDQVINNNNDLMETLENYNPDDFIKLTIDREGELYEVELKLTSSVRE